MAPKAADCKNVHNPNLQCKNDFLPYFDGFFLSLLKVYDHKIIFSWPLCIFGSKITKKNVSLIFYPKIPNPPPLRPLCSPGADLPPLFSSTIHFPLSSSAIQQMTRKLANGYIHLNWAMQALQQSFETCFRYSCSRQRADRYQDWTAHMHRTLLYLILTIEL